MAATGERPPDKPTHCKYGVPLRSHAGCFVCNYPIGCEGERPKASRHLCRSCELAGAVIGVEFGCPYRTPTDVAREFRVSLRTVYAWVREGTLESMSTRGGTRPRHHITLRSVECLRRRLSDGSTGL